MKIEELPSYKKLLEDINALNKIIQIGRIVPGKFGIDIKNIEKDYKSLYNQLDDYLTYGNKFNKFFSKNGWIVHDSLNINVIKEAVDQYEKYGIENGLKVIIDHYSPSEIEKTIIQFKGTVEFKVRFKFIEYALNDYKEKKYYSTIPLLLMVIDGAVNDGVGLGFHAQKVDVNVWDAITVADDGINYIKSIFQKGRYKTNSEVLHFPYRHGILHGLDLEYDNEIVAAKAWSFLYIVKDWLNAKKSELDRKQKFEEESTPPKWKDLFKDLNRIEQIKKGNKLWKPREIDQKYLDLLNSEYCPEEFTPEKIVIEFLELWKRKNFGYMAKLFWQIAEMMPKNVKEQYGYINVSNFSIVNIIDEAPAISEICTSVIVDDSKKIQYKFRMIYESGKGESLPRSIQGGHWRIVSFDIKRVKE